MWYILSHRCPCLAKKGIHVVKILVLPVFIMSVICHVIYTSVVFIVILNLVLTVNKESPLLILCGRVELK
jgi:hypothetical protein